MAADPGWTGVVLTGGASTRMGTDKAFVMVDGAPMALRVARAMQSVGAQRVICVGGDLGRLGALGLDTAPDLHPGDGPLGGLVSAFEAAADEAMLLVAPCDLLAPSAAAFRAIVDALRASRAVGVVPLARGVRQPLNGAYRAAARAPLSGAFAAGERSVKGAIALISIEEIDDIDPAALADADTPEDLGTSR
jgi:molybdopterin-guanine dinucleotide biosynthesis protein A